MRLPSPRGSGFRVQGVSLRLPWLRMPGRYAVGILAVFFVFVLLVALLGPALMRSTDPSVQVGLMPMEVPGGQVSSLTVTTSDPDGGVVYLSWALILQNGSRYEADRQIPFLGKSFAFNALVSPYVNTTNVTVWSGGKNTTFEVTVVEATGPKATDGKIWYDYLKTLTSTYPQRQTGRGDLYGAANWIQNEWTGLGYETELIHYRWSDRAAGIIGPRPILDRPRGDILVVTGTKPGERADEWIVIGGHMDSAWNDRTTGEGAYDDGSGTTSVMALAQAFRDIDTRATIVFAAWGGEEEGLYGSTRWVSEIPAGIHVKFYLNLDMAGLTYPNDLPFHGWVGPNPNDGAVDHPELLSIVQNITYNGLGVARNDTRMDVNESSFGRSDHVSFWRVDTPTVFHIGELDDYPYYHTPDDTLAMMEQYVGGPENLTRGFDYTLWFSLFTVLHVDDNDVIHQGEA